MISRKSYRRLKLRLHDIFLGFKIAAAIFAVALALLNAIYATIYKRIRNGQCTTHAKESQRL